MTPVEASDEELVIEDDAELLLERVEEEMAAEEPDSEEDEDVFLHVEDLNKVWIDQFSSIYFLSYFSFIHVLAAQLHPKSR